MNTATHTEIDHKHDMNSIADTERSVTNIDMNTATHTEIDHKQDMNSRADTDRSDTKI